MSRRPHSARAFTVMEVLLALTLASVVVGASIGLYGILYRSDEIGRTRFERAADLAVAQITLRRIMNTLVAAPPEDPGNAQANDSPTDESDDEEEDENEDNEESDDEASDEADEESDGIIVAAPADGSRIMFDLWWQEYAPDDGPPISVPIIEVVLSRPPVALRSSAEQIDEEILEDIDDSLAVEALRRTNRLSESVRGRIEIVAAPEGWRMRWQPIEPRGNPHTLISGIASDESGSPDVVWRALSRDEKVDEWQYDVAATLRTDFPIAVELWCRTNDNQVIAWLFETHVSVPDS